MTKKITIIGGGATGTLLTVNLIKYAGSSEPVEINLVEKQGRIGRGVAYSTSADFHLLNVPAGKMGAFPDDLEHFHRWLTAEGYDYLSKDFAQRKLYGEYLRRLFGEYLNNKNPNVTVNLLDDEAVDVLIDDRQTQVILSSGEILYSDKVVLAFGNFPPPHPKLENQGFVRAAKYFQNPWNSAYLEKINKSDDVFIIGTGLTMADVVLNLRHAEHCGKIYAFSTRGLLPAVHRSGCAYPSFYDELKTRAKITDLLKIVCRHIKKAEAENSDWRAVIDCLRPHTQEIWLNAPEVEKRRFMRHLSRYWNVARHRIPPEIADVLDEMQAANQLQILKGRLKNIESVRGEKFDVSYCLNGVEKEISVDAIINCIGSESNFRRVNNALVKNLLGRGVIRNDRLNLGIDALPDGRTINQSGAISRKIYTVGTALKGVLWESTAMPEIRTQTLNLALSLLSERGWG